MRNEAVSHSWRASLLFVTLLLLNPLGSRELKPKLSMGSVSDASAHFFLRVTALQIHFPSKQGLL